MYVRTNGARRVIILIAAMLVILLYYYAKVFVNQFHLPAIPASLLKHLIICVPVAAALLLLHRPKEMFRSLGLDGNFSIGMGFALISTLPLLLVFPIIGTFNDALTLSKLIPSTVFVAFFEELIFRGFVFGQLYRYGKIGFGWAVLIPSLLFGSLHLYQGHDPLSSLAAFGVTFIGALYFSWIYVKWDFNLWCPIGLHFFMNLSWQLFIVEGNSVAAGGLVSNILRILSIVVAIILTNVYLRRKAARSSGSGNEALE